MVKIIIIHSKIIGAAAALSYATFLVQAPLGIISSTILIPLLPVFVTGIIAGKNL